MRVATTRLPAWPGRLDYARAAPRLGQYMEAASAAVSTARTGAGFATGAYGFESTGQTLSTTGALVSTAGTLMALAAIPYVGWVAAAVGAILSIAGGFFGKPELTHAQRDAIFVNTKLNPAANQMLGQIGQAQTPQALWDVMIYWNTGYVGGASPIAIGVYFRSAAEKAGFAPVIGEGPSKPLMQQFVNSGEWILPPGYGTDLDRYLRDTAHAAVLTLGSPGHQNPLYPVWSMEGFYRYLVAHPEQLEADTQAGVGENFKEPINQAVAQAVIAKLQEFVQKGLLQPIAGLPPSAAGGPDPAQVTSWIQQAYQRLLGRNPSQAEAAAALDTLVSGRQTPEQFLVAVMQTPEFRARVAVPAAAAPSAPAPTQYWWQRAMVTPQGTLVEGAGQPVYSTLPDLMPMAPAALAAPGGGLFDWVGQHPLWALGLGGWLAVALVATSQPKRRRRR